ncbi:MAG: aminopeptidase N [Propionibacteriaceae bacterium]|jgi:aminopeptidase N|nr:aminopeptidase N [Propionibacteriaceae bacterium]
MPGKNLTRDEAEARAALLRVESYDIDLDLTGAGDSFRSVAEVVFDCLEPGADSFIDLIAPSVVRVELNGRELDPATVFQDCRVQLPNLQAHNHLLVEAAAAWSHTGEGLHRFTDPADGRTYCYSQFEVADARRVFANFEQPDLKARFRFRVTAPAAWTVWSNQPVAAVSPRGDQRQWQFEPTPVMSTYLTAVVAGPYQTWQDTFQSADGRQIPLSVLIRPSMAAHLEAAAVFDVTKRGFEFYEAAFGLPYPYAKYDQAFVPEYNAGAMENIGLVTLTEAYVFRSQPTQAQLDRRAITILHEQAHMWFGDLVTMRWWNDLWLNESFAEFVSHLAAANTSWPGAWTTFLAAEKSWALNQDQLPSTHPIVAHIRDLADVEVNFDGITYAKGASVLRQLMAWVGQENFLSGVGAYLRKHAWGNATLADLLAELERACGRGLTDWSKQWLEEAGVTLLRPGLQVADGVITDLTIYQERPPIYAQQAHDLGLPPVEPSLRPARLAVAGYDLGTDDQGRDLLSRSWSVTTDIAGVASPVSAARGRPAPALLLVNDGDLAYAKLRLDPASLTVAVARLGDLADPLARGLVWGSLWDAVRDGETPASRYVEAVLGAVARESGPTTVQTLLSQLHLALTYYVAPRRRPAARAAAADRLLELAQTAAPGSDIQLQLFKTFTVLARRPADLDALAAALDGAPPVPGLVVDTDRRWEIVTALVAQGRFGPDQIAAESKRDPTSRGRELAAGARAARLTPEAKSAAWIAAWTDETITNATQRSIIAGFNLVADRSLLVGFVEPYFAQLETVWLRRSREMATNVVQGLYPTLCLEQVDLVAATDAWLDQLGARQPALRRLVLESRAGVVRALAAQAADARDEAVKS